MNRIPLLTVHLNRLTISATFATIQGPKRLPRGFNKPSGFNLFTKENYDKTKKIPEESSRLSALWKGLSSDKKSEYIQQAEKIGEERRSKFLSLGKIEQESSIAISEELAKKRKIRRRLAAYREFRVSRNYPKRPSTGYTSYIQEYTNKQKPNSVETAVKAFTEAKNQWLTLSDEQKKPYVDKAAKAFAKYNAEVKKWKGAFGAEYKKFRAAYLAPEVGRPIMRAMKGRRVARIAAEGRRRIAAKGRRTAKK